MTNIIRAEEIFEYNEDAVIYPDWDEFYVGLVRRFSQYYAAYDFQAINMSSKKTGLINAVVENTDSVFILKYDSLDAAAERGYDKIYKPDGLEGSFVGVVVGDGQQRPDHGLFSYKKCVKIMADQTDPSILSEDETAEDVAREFLEFNTLGSWVGEKRSPFFLDDLYSGDDTD